MSAALQVEAPGSTEADSVAFDLDAFGRAMTTGDIAYVASRYASSADIRVVGPGTPLGSPRTVSGVCEIWWWLLTVVPPGIGSHVVRLVRAEDRVAFVQHLGSTHQDDTTLVVTSTAEVFQGLIAVQHTILTLLPTGVPPACP